MNFLSWGELGQLAVCGIVFFFAWRAFCDWANRRPVAPTVEQEEAKAREVAAHAPQWKNFPHPRTGQRSPLSSSSKSAPSPIVKPGSWKVAAVAPETREYDEWDVDDSTPESVSTFSRERGKAL